ncbi:cation:proton antiporter [Weissella confusa]|uniref:cation:proton antiporter n=1 Tax=Weissella confusa TaxID=1583 RepID=UPI000B1D5988|nr:sodium:proton antiporter [Weissella confusa]
MPRIPKAFWQILGGIILATIPVLSKSVVELDPEWFMMLIIAPLLFYEGKRTDVRLVSKNFRAIINLAGIIAVMTVVVLMLFGHWAIGWALPMALALAAIVTPTDATALESVTDGLEVPKGIGRALSLESLFNDATGLVVLELALLWMNTGTFSFIHGFEEFLIVALGGAVVGGIAGVVLLYIRQHLLRAQFDDTVAHVMIYFLSPILVYGLAEHTGVSGIIAVVVMGIISNEEKHHTQFMSSQLNNLNNQLTMIVSQLLNGLVFVLLGISLVRVFKTYIHSPLTTWLGYIGIGLAIYGVKAVFRHIMIERVRQDSPMSSMVDQTHKNRDAWIFALGGVHGTVTMAMAFSLPLTLDNGQAFPHRDMLLLIAATVIIVSLVAPLLILPRMLPEIKPEYDTSEYSEAHIAMINAAMSYVEGLDVSNSVKRNVIDQLQDQLGYGGDQLDRTIWQKALTDIQSVTDEAVEAAINAGIVSQQTMIYYRRVKANADSRWARGSNNVRMWFRILERVVTSLMRSRRLKPEERMRRINQKMQRRIDRLQRKATRRGLTEHEQHDLNQTLAMQKKFKAVKKTGYLNPDDAVQKYHSSRELVFTEIAEISEPAVAGFIAQAEAESEDPRYVVALRDVAAQERDRIRDQQVSSAEEQEILLGALSAELTFIQERRRDDRFSSALINELYNEVTSAQALYWQLMQKIN